MSSPELRKNETFSMLSTDKLLLIKISVKTDKSQAKVLSKLIREKAKRLGINNVN